MNKDAVRDHERPALGRLALDQRETVRALQGGFNGRRALLEWCVRAGVRTAGQLPGDRLKEYVTQRPTFAAMLSDSARESHDLASLVDSRTAELTRRYVEVDDYLPACQAATRTVRWSAAERTDIDDETRGVNPEGQANIGMRPALSRLENRQLNTLRRLLNGVGKAWNETPETWVHDLNLACYGEQPDRLTAMLKENSPWRPILTDSADGDTDLVARAAENAGIIPPAESFPADAPADARDMGVSAFSGFLRATVAATHLLPAFTKAADMVASRSGETVEGSEAMDTTPAKP